MGEGTQVPVEITAEWVRQIADLARLELDPEQVERLKDDLAEILAYVERLEELNTEQIEPMAHALDLSNVWAEDEPEPCLAREEALANAPKQDGEFFLVPPVL